MLSGLLGPARYPLYSIILTLLRSLRSWARSTASFTVVAMLLVIIGLSASKFTKKLRA